MSNPDYRTAAERAQKWLDEHRPEMKKAWGGDRRVAHERCRRWCEAALERLSAEYLNILAPACGVLSGAGLWRGVSAGVL
jgi:hypothetical protein